jgi:uncharacterized protein (DUF2336 family)
MPVIGGLIPARMGRVPSPILPSRRPWQISPRNAFVVNAPFTFVAANAAISTGRLRSMRVTDGRMMFDEQWPRLEGLFALSQARGLDVRPTLLRVLTDMFVESGPRTDIEIQRFAELATHLIDQVDEDTRIVVAGKLGPCPFAPRVVIDKLIGSEPEPAGRIIEASPLLSLDDLWTLATDGGPMTSAAVARRSDLPVDLVAFLARKPYPLVAETLAQNASAPLDRESVALLAAELQDSPDLAQRIACRTGIRPSWLAPLFLDLDRGWRIAILDALRSDAGARRSTTREAQLVVPKLVLESIEFAALSRRLEDVALALAQLLDISGERAARIVLDPAGEALTVTLIAIGMSPEQTGRILMFCNEGAGQSVDRLRELAVLADTLPRLVAVRLVRAFTAAPRIAGGRHETVFSESTPA